MEVHFIKMEVGLTYRWLFINEQSDEYRKQKKKKKKNCGMGTREKNRVHYANFFKTLNCL